MEHIVLINHDWVLHTAVDSAEPLPQILMVAYYPVALFSHSDACIKEMGKFFLRRIIPPFVRSWQQMQ